MKEGDSSKIETSSFSFNNFNWGDNPNKEPEDLVYPTVLDPSFKDYYVEIGEGLQKYLSLPKPTFTYRIIKDFVVNIMLFSTCECVLELKVVDFEMIEFLQTNSLTIVLNREAFKRKNKTKLNKEYKKNILRGEHVGPVEDKYLGLMFKIFEMQTKNRHNFLFIDTPDDFVRDIKNIVKSIKTENVFTPKIKSFKSQNKAEHFAENLLKIPGIGKCVARAISQKFKTMKNFYLKLVAKPPVDLENLMIWDKENGKGRPLGKYQADKIKKVFLSEDAETLLIE